MYGTQGRRQHPQQRCWPMLCSRFWLDIALRPRSLASSAPFSGAARRQLGHSPALCCNQGPHRCLTGVMASITNVMSQPRVKAAGEERVMRGEGAEQRCKAPQSKLCNSRQKLRLRRVGGEAGGWVVVPRRHDTRAALPQRALGAGARPPTHPR